MKACVLATISALTALFSAAALAQADPLVGVWELVERTNRQGEVVHAPYGLLVVTDPGIYVLIELPKGRPEVNKPDAELTLEELRARYRGVVAHHGTYSVGGDRLTANIVAHLDPNREGDTSVRKITIDGGTLTISSANDPDFPALSKYRRVR
jgi:hypothetical protein